MDAYFFFKWWVILSDMMFLGSQSFSPARFVFVPLADQSAWTKLVWPNFVSPPSMFNNCWCARHHHSAGPWLYKGVGWMKRSAEAAPEPDSVHPAGVATFLTVQFT